MNPVLAAWAVHLYTAMGAVIALLAWEATSRNSYGLAFAWMAVALFIDCTDGTLARRVRVKEILPYFDGAKLDDIVDYLNYVVVPVILAYQAGMIPFGFTGVIVGALPLLASGYGFCHANAKTADHFFTGFPSYWNVVVFYFYILATPVWFNIATLVLLSTLVFVPMRYFYPSRTPTARRTTQLLGAVWALCFVAIIAMFPTPPRWLAWLSLFFPVYYIGMSVHLHLRSRRHGVAAHH
jgi:phosphatidylcholine synthase